MKNKFLIFLMAAAGPLLAHHGTAAYNTKDPVTVSGTVTDFQFLNPHSIVSFDVKGEKGDRPQFPGGPQQIQRRWVWLRYDLASGGGKPIGDAFLGGNNDD